MAFTVRKAIKGVKGQIVSTRNFDTEDEAAQYAWTCVFALNAVWAEVWKGGERISLHIAR